MKDFRGGKACPLGAARYNYRSQEGRLIPLDWPLIETAVDTAAHTV
jgi:hypothetical protein